MPLPAPKLGASDRFDYGFVPPKLFALAARGFTDYLAARPRGPHVRSVHASLFARCEARQVAVGSSSAG